MKRISKTIKFDLNTFFRKHYGLFLKWLFYGFLLVGFFSLGSGLPDEYIIIATVLYLVYGVCGAIVNGFETKVNKKKKIKVCTDDYNKQFAIVFGFYIPLVFVIFAGHQDIIVPVLWMVPVIFVLGELLYWVSCEKPGKKEDLDAFVWKQKGGAFLKAILLVFTFDWVRRMLGIVDWGAVQFWVQAGVIGFVLVFGLIGVLKLWFWLNKLKYRKFEKKIGVKGGRRK